MLKFVENESNIWVRGGKDTSELKCEVCKGWLKHWKKLKKISEDTAVNCCHPEHKKTENKKADRGAHVMKQKTPKGEKDLILSQSDNLDIVNKRMFIIPVCEDHNITDEQVILVSKELLVDAEPCKQESSERKNVRLGLRV